MDKITNPRQYQKEAARTVSDEYLDVATITVKRHLRLAIAALGFAGEFLEYLVERYDFVRKDNHSDDKVLKEAGDIAWYLADITRILNEQLPPASGNKIDDDRMIEIAIEISESIKKYIAHGHDKPKMQILLSDFIEALENSSGYISEEIFTENIRKLRERYPNGFSKERSINRKDD